VALNPITFTERVVDDFLHYQLTTYPLADQDLYSQLRALLRLEQTRDTPLRKGPFVSLSRPFKQGATVQRLIDDGVFHPTDELGGPLRARALAPGGRDPRRASGGHNADLDRHWLRQDRIVPLSDHQPLPRAAGAPARPPASWPCSSIQ
jgi:hypothetical protein